MFKSSVSGTSNYPYHFRIEYAASGYVHSAVFHYNDTSGSTLNYTYHTNVEIQPGLALEVYLQNLSPSTWYRVTTEFMGAKKNSLTHTFVHRTPPAYFYTLV